MCNDSNTISTQLQCQFMTNAPKMASCDPSWNQITACLLVRCKLSSLPTFNFCFVRLNSKRVRLLVGTASSHCECCGLVRIFLETEGSFVLGSSRAQTPITVMCKLLQSMCYFVVLWLEAEAMRWILSESKYWFASSPRM